MNAKWISNPKLTHSCFSYIFGAHTNILFIVKMCAIYTSCKMTTVQPPYHYEQRMVDNFQTRSPISYDYMSFWSPFSIVDLTTHHSNIGVHFKWVIKVWLAYLITNKVGILIPTYQEIGHLHLSGMWLCVDPRTCTKNTFVLEEIKLRVQNMLTILGSTINMVEGNYITI